MGLADTLMVQGKENMNVYQAIMARDKEGKPTKISNGQRHFCKHCGSSLWMWDSRWPELVHPLASSIDTDLPIPPEHIDICLASKANWCEIPEGENERHFDKFNDESIEDWHRRHHLEVK